jgi:hypothetical protein
MEEKRDPVAMRATRVKTEAAVVFDVEAKMAKVRESKIPDEDKEKLLRKLGSASSEAQKIRFGAYANMKGISQKMRAAMQAYPKARDIVSATVEQWDEILKGF